jgi:hypothetical protein
VLATGARSVASGDLHRLYFQAVNKYNLSIVRIFSDAADLDAKSDLPVPIEQAAKLKAFLTRQQIFEARATLFVKRTVRSGQTIDFDGHVVVYGNVNPGGMVRATGNVTVFGKLLGACGRVRRRTAFVAARDRPVQIRRQLRPCPARRRLSGGPRPQGPGRPRGGPTRAKVHFPGRRRMDWKALRKSPDRRLGQGGPASRP